jgi:hypothetical protein
MFGFELYTYSVPILDAREKKLKLPDDLKNVVKSFPRFSGSVPQDSVVLTCYTTSKYEKNGNPHASFNIQWAAVVCGDESVFNLHRSFFVSQC